MLTLAADRLAELTRLASWLADILPTFRFCKIHTSEMSGERRRRTAENVFDLSNVNIWDFAGKRIRHCANPDIERLQRNSSDALDALGVGFLPWPSMGLSIGSSATQRLWHNSNGQ